MFFEIFNFNQDKFLIRKIIKYSGDNLKIFKIRQSL